MDKKADKKYLEIISHFSGKVIKDPFQVIYVPTKKVHYSPYKHRYLKKIVKERRPRGFPSKRIKVGFILGGEWDEELTPVKFDDLSAENYDLEKDKNNKFHYAKILGIKQRFLQDRNWENTPYYFLEGEKEFDNERLQNITAGVDKLHKKIKKEGLKRNSEIATTKMLRDVAVVVTREGKIVKAHHEGHHRYALAHVLGLDIMPVLVVAWHKKYINWIKKNIDIDEITPETAIKPAVELEEKISCF